MYIAVWTTALLGIAIGRRVQMEWIVFMLPALVAVSQYAAVVLVYPKGERLILPVHTLLVPYSALAVDATMRRLRRTAAREVTL